MGRRSYGQYCGLAQALDHVGERWTLLIVRELLVGPARFKELTDGLPGLATNLLTERLRTLEAEGLVIQRLLPPPANVNVYQLTPLGYALEPVVLDLARWGLHWMKEAAYRQPSPRTLVVSLRAILRQEMSRGLHAALELHLDADRLSITIDDGCVEVQYGVHQTPDAVLDVAYPTLLGVMARQIPIDEVPERVAVASGDPAALDTLCELFRRLQNTTPVAACSED